MAEKQETITDIIAEKRRRAEAIERDCAEKMKRGEMVSDRYARELVADIRREADRMESALKRERGNYAKLREVVGDLLYMAERYAGRTPATETVIVDPETKKEIRTINYYAVIEKAQSILSDPPRNCDRFATETDAQIAFLNERWLIGVSNLDLDPFDGWTNEMKSAYSKWIFAPAQEKEGGAK